MRVLFGVLIRGSLLLVVVVVGWLLSPGEVPFFYLDTPLATLVEHHVIEQCEPFRIQYNNAVELGALREHSLARLQRLAFCQRTVQEKLHDKCAQRVGMFQNAVAAAGPDPSKGTPEAQEALKEAMGRLKFCARYPHPVDPMAVNPRPVQWYFQTKENNESK